MTDRPAPTLHEEDPWIDDVDDALEIVDNGGVLRVTATSRNPLWVARPKNSDEYVQVTPSEQTVNHGGFGSIRTTLRHYEEIEAWETLEVAPSDVEDAVEGREPGQEGLGSF